MRCAEAGGEAGDRPEAACQSGHFACCILVILPVDTWSFCLLYLGYIACWPCFSGFGGLYSAFVIPF